MKKNVFCFVIYIDVCLLGHGENGVIYIERREIETELNKKFLKMCLMILSFLLSEWQKSVVLGKTWFLFRFQALFNTQ